jgi:hypothetical protein
MNNPAKTAAKVAFLHAAHNFASTPSAANWHALEAAMSAHQVAVFPPLAATLAQQARNDEPGTYTFFEVTVPADLYTAHRERVVAAYQALRAELDANLA